MAYDSAYDNMNHVDEVRNKIRQVVVDLEERAIVHDASKFEKPEKPIFDEFTPKLKDSTYGSDEYKQFLADMKPALDHHYAVNDHHPEHFQFGIKDMNLVQLIEMLCDWKAASMRHDDGDLGKSIEINADRFGYDKGLTAILWNTANYFGWL